MTSIRADIVQVHPCRRVEERLECLLLRRRADDPDYPGVWQVITGATEPGERAIDAARREVIEETGLTPRLLIPYEQPSSYYLADRDEIIHSPTFACLLETGTEPVLGVEHDRYLWLEPALAMEYLAFRSHRQGVAMLVDLLRSTTIVQGQ